MSGQRSAAIVGAGAMGSIVGAALVEAGVRTHFVDVSEALVDHLGADGLTIERGGRARSVDVAATTDPASVGPVDAVLFFVKCYQTAAASELARPLVGGATTVATLQNGWGNGDVLASHFPPERLVPGITYHSGTVRGLGLVAHTNLGDAPTLVGPYAGDDVSGAALLADDLRRGGLGVEVTPGIRSEVWKKVVLNSATLPTAALTRLTAGALGAHARMSRLVAGLARESSVVGRAAGFDVDPEERVSAIAGILDGAGDGKASMLQDVEAGRRTEIDVINGAVVQLAELHGVEVPLNRAMAALIAGYEQAQGLASSPRAVEASGS